jgi:hypothetical protein
MDTQKSEDMRGEEYPIKLLSGPSSGVEKVDITELVDELQSLWQKNIRLAYSSRTPFPLSYLFEIDYSSVWPRFEIKNETFVDGVSEEMILERMVRHDFIVKMPPVSEYTIKVKIKSIDAATPHIVTP